MLTYNIEGTKHNSVLLEIINDEDPDIILIQEIWLRSQNVQEDFLRYFSQPAK